MLTDERMFAILEKSGMKQSHGGRWIDPIAFARAVEREARREALEEAARVADAAYTGDLYPDEVAAAIRALIEKEGA